MSYDRERERWRCQGCAFVTDKADTMTMHGANTDHPYMFGTGELFDLLTASRVQGTSDPAQDSRRPSSTD